MPVKEKVELKEHRLDGKKIVKSESDSANATQAGTSKQDDENKRGIPDYNYKIGLLRLNRIIEKEEPQPVTHHFYFNKLIFDFNLKKNINIVTLDH